jgi:predicted ABC-type ATPase
MFVSEGDRVTIMFAGPNGSGKSSARDPVLADFKGEYINADDIAASLANDIADYAQRNIVAANLAEQRRVACMREGKSFAFETVMSTPEKVAILTQARSLGFSVEMVFVSTSDPSINISRVAVRVEKGGHSVSPEKIRSRYEDTMALLPSALGSVDRALVFDNSVDDAPALLVAAKYGFAMPLEVKNLDVCPDWARLVLKQQMDARHASLAYLASMLKKEFDLAPQVRLADASHGMCYEGRVIAVTAFHALQEQAAPATGVPSFVVHDLALTQQKQLAQGAHSVVSYEYKFGKIIDAPLESKKGNHAQVERG